MVTGTRRVMAVWLLAASAAAGAGEPPRDGKALLFVLGAADRLWARAGLDDLRFPPYAEQLVGRLAVRSGGAASLVAALPQLPHDPFASRALRQGAGHPEVLAGEPGPQRSPSARRADRRMAAGLIPPGTFPSAQPTTRGAS
jgi:hypothetical protein